jgi:Transcription factor Pcc1
MSNVMFFVDMSENIHINLDIPFPSKRAAQIAYDVLRVDAEPKRNHIKKSYELTDNVLHV